MIDNNKTKVFNRDCPLMDVDNEKLIEIKKYLLHRIVSETDIVDFCKMKIKRYYENIVGDGEYDSKVMYVEIKLKNINTQILGDVFKIENNFTGKKYLDNDNLQYDDIKKSILHNMIENSEMYDYCNIGYGENEWNNKIMYLDVNVYEGEINE